MLIISNDCSCYEFYKYLNTQYNHPFIGNRQFKTDFINTVKHFKTINFLNVEYYPCDTFSHIGKIDNYLKVKVDNLIDIHFIHYSYYDKYNPYINRANRLEEIKNIDTNITFICNENGSCNNCFNELKELCDKNNYKLIYCSNNFNEEILKDNVLTINKQFRPRDLHMYILENEKYKNWLLHYTKRIINYSY